jgi:hypothetical protein
MVVALLSCTKTSSNFFGVYHVLAGDFSEKAFEPRGSKQHRAPPALGPKKNPKSARSAEGAGACAAPSVTAAGEQQVDPIPLQM